MTIPSFQHGASNEPLIFETINDAFRRSVELCPTKEFLVFPEQKIRKTYLEVYQDVDRLAAVLLRLGLNRGDRVAVWSRNCYEAVILQLAAGRVGGILVKIDPDYAACELQYSLQKVGVKILFLPGQKLFWDIFMEACPRNSTEQVGQIISEVLPELQTVVVMEVIGDYSSPNFIPPDALFFNDLMREIYDILLEKVAEVAETVLPDDPVTIQYTSGTTGFPKAATLTHFAVLNNAIFTGRRAKWHERHLTLCICSPLFHCFASIIGVLGSMCFQHTCVFPSYVYNARKVLETIEKERCNFTFGPPAKFMELVALQKQENFDVSSLCAGYIGTSPCPIPLCLEIQNILNIRDLYVLYGTTEMSPLITMSLPSEAILDRIQSVGHVMPHIMVAIVDRKGRVLPRGQAGELLSKGYGVMRGYWNDEEKTKEAHTADGWWHTGDTAIMNNDNSISIVGRTKEVIKKFGENVYPTEIENFINTFPFVADTQVIGVPDEILGEEICIWVKLKPHAVGKFTAEDIFNSCAGKIAPLKIPGHIFIRDDFPLTTTGKVKKSEMRRISMNFLGIQEDIVHFESVE